MNTATWVQILDEAVCISHIANTFGKGMNPTILSASKIVGQTVQLGYGNQKKLLNKKNCSCGGVGKNIYLKNEQTDIDW